MALLTGLKNGSERRLAKPELPPDTATEMAAAMATTTAATAIYIPFLEIKSFIPYPLEKTLCPAASKSPASLDTGRPTTL